MAYEYYSTLGIDRNASPDDIKKAYRKKAMECHPDRHQGDRDQEALFKKVNEAYATLSDPQKKSRYDQRGTADDGQGGFGGFQGFGGMDGVDLSDIFESFFGGGGGGQRRGAQREQRGEDLTIETTITFAEMVEGVRQTVSYRRHSPCSTCHGTGAEPGSQPKECPDCHGHGSVRRTVQSLFGYVEQVVPCDRCSGSGQTIDRPCTACRGARRTVESTEYAVDIPAGIEDSMTIRITGEGSASVSGHRGDLYITVHVPSEEDGLTRRGADLHYTVLCDPAELALGTHKKIIIPILGERTLDISHGTQHGTVVTFRREGLHHVEDRRRARGDLHCTIEVRIPDRLSDRERELYTDLAREAGHGTDDGKGFFSKVLGL